MVDSTGNGKGDATRPRAPGLPRLVVELRHLLAFEKITRRTYRRRLKAAGLEEYK